VAFQILIKERAIHFQNSVLKYALGNKLRMRAGTMVYSEGQFQYAYCLWKSHLAAWGLGLP